MDNKKQLSAIGRAAIKTRKLAFQQSEAQGVFVKLLCERFHMESTDELPDSVVETVYYFGGPDSVCTSQFIDEETQQVGFKLRGSIDIEEEDY